MKINNGINSSIAIGTNIWLGTRAEQYLQDDEGLSKWNERKASFASIASASQIAAAAAAISVFGTFL